VLIFIVCDTRSTSTLNRNPHC